MGIPIRWKSHGLHHENLQFIERIRSLLRMRFIYIQPPEYNHIPAVKNMIGLVEIRRFYATNFHYSSCIGASR